MHPDIFYIHLYDSQEMVARVLRNHIMENNPTLLFTALHKYTAKLCTVSYFLLLKPLFP